MPTHNVETKPIKAMNPDRLRKLIDSPSVFNDTRNVPLAIGKAETLVTSWNGEKCDFRAFEKLAAPAHVIRTKDLRACADSAGKAVAIASSGLQMNDVAILPKKEQLQDQPTVFLMTKKDTITHAAEIEHCAIPNSISLKEGIMTPHQRRERLQFETDYLNAKRAIHRAEMNDRRRHQIIKERHSTCNVLGTQQDALQAEVESWRPDLLGHIGSGPSRREYQSKNSTANPRIQNHDRLFNVIPFKRNQQRAQDLRNQSTGGRSYDIINGGHITHFQPTNLEKRHQWQAHPSVNIHRYTR